MDCFEGTGGSLRQSLTSEIAEIGVAVTSSASVACGYAVGDVGAGEVYGRCNNETDRKSVV